MHGLRHETFAYVMHTSSLPLHLEIDLLNSHNYLGHSVRRRVSDTPKLQFNPWHLARSVTPHVQFLNAKMIRYTFAATSCLALIITYSLLDV